MQNSLNAHHAHKGILQSHSLHKALLGMATDYRPTGWPQPQPAFCQRHHAPADSAAVSDAPASISHLSDPAVSTCVSVARRQSSCNNSHCSEVLKCTMHCPSARRHPKSAGGWPKRHSVHCLNTTQRLQPNHSMACTMPFSLCPGKGTGTFTPLPFHAGLLAPAACHHVCIPALSAVGL